MVMEQLDAIFTMTDFIFGAAKATFSPSFSVRRSVEQQQLREWNEIPLKVNWKQHCYN